MVRTTPSISTFLWFERNAEAAAEFYTTLFPNSRITKIARWGDGGPAPKGSVMTVAFELAGQSFVALNGGPHFKFDEAVSFQVYCESQAEVDYFWSKLSAGGQEGPCGWLKDKFGLSWQVVPVALLEMMMDPDASKSARVMKAFLQMKKFDIAALKRAYDGQAA